MRPLLIALRPYAYILVVATLLAALCGAAAVAATPVRAAPLDVVDLAAARYGLDSGYLHRVALCESSGNPYAVSPGGAYVGLYQFSHNTWQWASAQAGYAGYSRYDAEASAMTAAWLLRRPGGAAHWPVCGRRW